MPGPRSLVDTFLSRLEKLEIPYVVTGAVAAIIYGEPRLTNDVDLIMMMKTEDIERFVQAFPATEFYCPPAEVLKIEIRRPQRGHFILIHHDTGMKADIYLAGEDELHRWALSKKTDMAIEGECVRVAPPEYVIVRKLEYYREGSSEKHLRDIAGMVELSSDQIDFKELEEFIHRYGLEKAAAKQGSVLLTEDKDFGEWIFAHGQSAEGVVLIRFPARIRKEMIEAVVEVVTEHGAELTGAFAVLEPGKVRIRSI